MEFAYLDALDAANQSGLTYSDPGNPGGHFRLELWPAEAPEPPTELRRWPGYAEQGV